MNDAVNNGERKIAVCRMFQISRNTLDLWLKREEATGDCRAVTGFQSGNRHKITDWDRFRQFVRAQGGQDSSSDGKVVGRQCDAAGHQSGTHQTRSQSLKKTYGYRERDELKRHTPLI